MKNKNFYKACYLLTASILPMSAMDAPKVVEVETDKATAAVSFQPKNVREAVDMLSSMVIRGLESDQEAIKAQKVIRESAKLYLANLPTEKRTPAFNQLIPLCQSPELFLSVCRSYTGDQRLTNVILGIFKGLFTLDEVLQWQGLMPGIPSNRHLAIISETYTHKDNMADIASYFSIIPESLAAFDLLDRRRQEARSDARYKQDYARTRKEIFSPVLNAVIIGKSKSRNFAEDVAHVRALLPSHPIMPLTQTALLLTDIYGTESVDIARFMAGYAGFQPICYGHGYSADLARLMAICYNKMGEVDSLKAVLNALPQNPEETDVEYDELGEPFYSTIDYNYWRAQCVKDFLAIAETEHFVKRVKAFALWSSIDRFACYEFRDMDSSCLTDAVIYGLHDFLSHPPIDKYTFFSIFQKNNRLLNEQFFTRVTEASLPLFSLVRRDEEFSRGEEREVLATKILQAVQVLSDDQIAILFPDDVIARVQNLPIRGQIDIFERLAALSAGYQDRVRESIIRNVLNEYTAPAAAAGIAHTGGGHPPSSSS